ncbi:ferritin-like domain-containing protein [Clostridium sp.]|uniref:ferritin-like domain-containing protein n=1 Tax=Clostridium sp. TaxID=1506 RepID=UPI003216F280
MYIKPRVEEQMMHNTQLQEALERVKEAIQGEREDELFYDFLISMAPTMEEKDIITSIRDDERRHNREFRKIYKDFTGMEVPTVEGEAFERPESYIDGIKKALFGELRAVERYRDIRRALGMGPQRDVLFDIITDELKHSSKYNYLFTLNRSMESPSMNRRSMQDTSKFTPDDWVRYITPLVTRASAEAREGINLEHLYQEFILSGVLVGLGKTPQEAIEQVEEWERTGASKLLAESKMARGYYYY